MVTDDDDDDMVNNGITIPYYNGNLDADDDVDYGEDRYDDDDDDDDLCLNYAFCNLFVLYLP